MLLKKREIAFEGEVTNKKGEKMEEAKITINLKDGK